MKKTSVVLTSVLAFVASQTALADNRAGAFSITPEIGYYYFASKRQLENTAAIPAIAIGYDFTPNWGIEFEYANVNTRYKSAALPASGSVKGNLYTVDGIYFLNGMGPNAMIQPYVDFGVGVLNINPNGTSASNQANLNGALGAEFFFSDSIALRGEVRDLYTMSGGKNDVMLDLGVTFLIGGNTPAPVVYKDTFKDVK